MTNIPICPQCGGKSKVVCTKCQNQADHYWWRCVSCGENVLKRWISHKEAEEITAKYGKTIRDIQLFFDYSGSQVCSVCGSSEGVELHHFAPKHLFQDAEKWPMTFLCKKCHSRWHERVTPNMTGDKVWKA